MPEQENFYARVSIEAQNPTPKSRNTTKTPHLRELVRKVRANFCLLSCDASQKHSRNCSEQLVQMNLFILGGLFGWIFLFQKFRKGVGGQRGLPRGNPSKTRNSGLFLYPFSYAPLGEWGHISGELFGPFLGVCLSPTPSRQPLFETSDSFESNAGGNVS